jgi:hypothetical protein
VLRASCASKELRIRDRAALRPAPPLARPCICAGAARSGRASPTARLAPPPLRRARSPRPIDGQQRRSVRARTPLSPHRWRARSLAIARSAAMPRCQTRWARPRGRPAPQARRRHAHADVARRRPPRFGGDAGRPGPRHCGDDQASDAPPHIPLVRLRLGLPRRLHRGAGGGRAPRAAGAPRGRGGARMRPWRGGGRRFGGRRRPVGPAVRPGWASDAPRHLPRRTPSSTLARTTHPQAYAKARSRDGTANGHRSVTPCPMGTPHVKLPGRAVPCRGRVRGRGAAPLPLSRARGAGAAALKLCAARRACRLLGAARVWPALKRVP